MLSRPSSPLALQRLGCGYMAGQHCGTRNATVTLGIFLVGQAGEVLVISLGSTHAGHFIRGDVGRSLSSTTRDAFHLNLFSWRIPRAASKSIVPTLTRILPYD